MIKGVIYLCDFVIKSDLKQYFFRNFKKNMKIA